MLFVDATVPSYSISQTHQPAPYGLVGEFHPVATGPDAISLRYWVPGCTKIPATNMARVKGRVVLGSMSADDAFDIAIKDAAPVCGAKSQETHPTGVKLYGSGMVVGAPAVNDDSPIWMVDVGNHQQLIVGLHWQFLDWETQRPPRFGDVIKFSGFLLDILPQATTPFFVPILEADLHTKLWSTVNDTDGVDVA